MNKRTSWNRKDLDVDLIKSEYLDNHKSTIEIAKILNVKHPTILKRLHEMNIPVRSKDEAMKSERTRNMMSVIKKGIKLSIVTRKAISEGHKGLFRSKEHNRKIGEAQLGKVIPQDQRDKMRQAKIRYISSHPEERERLRANRAKQVFPLKDSKIEVKLQNLLKELEIDFYCHYFVDISDSYQCDIYIPIQKGIDHKIILEADGDYWHGNPKIYSDWRQLNLKQKLQKIKDFDRTNQLEEKGYKVIRIWESDIKVLSKEQLMVMLK